MGNKEMEKLILDNQAVVYFIVDKYFANFHLYKNEIREELISEGMVALIKAIKTYDPSKGRTISSYVGDAIVWSINRYINREKTNRTNSKTAQTLNKQGLSVESYDKDCTDDETGSSVVALVGGEKDERYDFLEIWNMIETSNIKDITQIVKLRILGYSYEDIGKEVGVTKEMVRRRIEKLKKELEPFYDLKGVKQKYSFRKGRKKEEESK